MIDPTKLATWKALAEAAPEPRKWYTADELLKRRAMPEADGRLIAAMTPANVLDLIAEIERLTAPPPEADVAKDKT